MKQYFTVILLFISLHYISAQTLEKRIDSTITTVFGNNNKPGVTILIAKNGQPIYEKAFGKANLELDVDMITKNVFQIGSITKQFTAISILILEKQGKLNTDDPISKYILDYPNGKNITLTHLLTHTSGIKDFTRVKGLSDITQKEMTPKMMVDFFKNEPVDFEPGEKFEYNNSGYILLGHIIELTSGTTYDDFIQKNIFDKIGMSNSHYATDRMIIKNRASGYHEKSTGFVNKTIINYSLPFSSGSLMSTVEDMLKWQNALKNNLILDAKSLNKAFVKNKLNNGKIVNYGFGWHLKDIDGIPTQEHGGSIFGFKSMGVYIPSKDIYVIAFSNCDCHSPTEVTREIARLVLEN